MASKGPILGAAVPAEKPVDAVVAAPVGKSVESIPAALAAQARSKPVAVPAPVPAGVAKPAPVVAKKPVVAAAKPVVNPAPVAAPPAPVITAQDPEPAVAPAPVIMQKETISMETIQSTAEATQARAETLFTEAKDRAKTAMEKGSKMVEEMNDFSKGNLEAIVESSKIAAKGIETMSQEAAEYSRKQVENATAVLKTLSSVKSPTDFFKLHSDYMRSAFDAMVAETSKNTESMLKLAGEIVQPISNRAALAAEKMKIAA